MGKTGKKLFAAVLGTVMALTPVIAPLQVFAEAGEEEINMIGEGASYTITLDANGGEFAGGDATRDLLIDDEHPKSSYEIDSPSYDGHSFTEWSLDPEGGDPWTLDGAAEEDQRVYAIWEKDPVAANIRITVYKNDVGVKDVSVSLTSTDVSSFAMTDENGIANFADIAPGTYEVSQESSVEGYTFPMLGSIVVADDGTASATSPEALIKDDVQPEGVQAFHYSLVPVIFDLVTELDGGHYEGDPNPTEYTIESDDITLVNPVKEGCDFIGWIGGGSETPVNPVVIPSGSSGDRIYTAVWVGTTYNISYDLDGGVLPDGKSNPATYTKDETYTLVNPEKAGFIFTGWSGTDIPEGTTQGVVEIPLGSMGDRAYKANWEAEVPPEPTTYTITYSGMEGASLPSGKTNPSTYTINDHFELVNPTKTGFTFAGWASNYYTDVRTVVVVESGKQTGNLAYTATWTKNPDPSPVPATYYITYDLKGGAADNPDTYTADDLPIKLNNPTRDGYKFEGWSGSGISGKSTSVEIKKGATGDKSYTAHWTSVKPVVETGSLTVRNIVQGTGANLDKKFKFTIGLTNNGKAVSESFDCSGVVEGRIQFSNGKASVKLANSEYITIAGIPDGYDVTVDQDAVDGYSTNPSNRNAHGTMKGGMNMTATFTNEKTSDTPTPGPNPSITPVSTANLTFNHTTNGDGADKEKMFQYTLTVMNGSTPLTGSYSFTGTRSGTAAFSAEGKLMFQMKDGQSLTIQGLPTSVSYTVTKSSTDDGYTFTKDVQDGQLTGNRTVSLIETKGSITPSITNTPGKNGSTGTESGTVSASTDASLTNVKTGDDNEMLPYVVVIVVAAFVVLVTLSGTKKKKKNNEEK